MEVLRGCRSSCGPCNAVDTALEGNCKPKLCSWAEEEVSMDGGEGSVGLDYGFLGRLTFAHQASSPMHTRSSSSELGARSPVYDTGALVPVRGLGRDKRGPHLLEVYALDEQPLGRGSYGEVIGATHRRTRARRAVKSVGKAGLRKYVKDVSSFVRREVDILRRLDHPNIIRLYEAFEDDATIYIVLEVCEGGDLLERVTVARERLPERAAAGLLMQMLSAVQHLYLRGVVHRDIKPENFLFSRREPEREPLPPIAAPVKLIDFGLSRRLSFEAGTRMTPKIGTTEYMAPEAFAGRVKPVLADRTDIWSLGVVLHVIFIGHFPSPRLAELTTEEYLSLACWKRISPQGRDLLGQLLRHDPQQRPTVTQALKHPWLAATTMASAECAPLARGLPSAFRSLAQSSDLRRIALVAAAREEDDSCLYRLREIYLEIEIACEGALTRPALERAAISMQPILSSVTAELLRCFESVDIDGSGSIDWTEFVAAGLGASVPLRTSKRSSAPRLSEDTCWRAFDLLSQGTGQISGASLAHLLLPGETGGYVEPSGSTGGTTDAGLHKQQSVSELHRMVREVDAGGAVGRSAFTALMQGY